MEEEELLPQSPLTGEMIALLTVLSLFTVVGSVGNGLVLFVFSRVRDKTTAQIFILALALIDLFTCMVIIPFTMFVEYTRYDIKYDFLCKLYQFLITSKVPLSAFIMVAIAFDRYFCICLPLKKIITPWRTKVVIVSLALFASILGVMTSLAYGVYQVYNPNDTEMPTAMINNTFTTGAENIKDWSKLGEDPITKNDVTMNVELRLKDYISKRNSTLGTLGGHSWELVYIGICAPNEILLDWGFVSVYQKCYTALFGVCLVIVGILYGMIYRFIGLRRNKKLQQKLVLCAYVNGDNGCGEAGTRTTFLNGNGHDNHNDDDKYGCTGQGLGAGGVYIGECTTPPSTTKTAGSRINSSSSFNREPEMVRPGVVGKDDKQQKEAPSVSKLDSADLAQEDRLENGMMTFLGRDSCKADGDVHYHLERDAPGKSPSPLAPRRAKKKYMLSTKQRCQSMSEESNYNSKPFQLFRKRRASSPFKKDVFEANVGIRIEMKTLAGRADSEPLLEAASPASSCRFIQGPEEDMKICSRYGYSEARPKSCAGEDCALLDPQKSSCLGIPRVNTASSFVYDLESELHEDTSEPLITKDPKGHLRNKSSTKAIHDNESDDLRQPLLLQDPGKDNNSQAKNSLNRKECNICVGKHSQPITDSGTKCADTDTTFPQPPKEDSGSKALTVNTLNNRYPNTSSSQQVVLTSYVRNLTPFCSTSSSNLSPYRSCSESSRRSTMEESVVRSSSFDLPSRHAQDTSRHSTMESTARRPAVGRKKRWQHFRCKKASIKGCHGRSSCSSNSYSNSHTHGKSSSSLSAGGHHYGDGRRSIMSYDADRLREETRAANARTALMLFTVTLVFVVAFLPAWLMAHRIVPNQLMVFYLYFTYNVANPFIYAFMNVIFKEHLRKIFRCHLCQ
ncbi:hypothetical protein ACOMHN_067237 [Nucella lapillus]